MTSTRPNQHAWVTAFGNSPPAACATLRALSNIVEYGLTCVFAEEDGDPLPDSVNTACLPWATGSVSATSTFYSPATACPTSWTVVATRTDAEDITDWISGETALECCPPGFIGGGAGMCNPGPSGMTPVVECGEADADENETAIYTAGGWPASASARVTALQLRYQPTDVGLTGSVSATRSGSSGTSTNSSGVGHGDNGLSAGAKAAIGTVIPLVFILGLLVAFLLWRRRKHRHNAAMLSKEITDGHESKHSYENVHQHTINNSESTPDADVRATATTAPATRKGPHETPEWNTELDATEAERKRYLAVQGSLFMTGNGAKAAASSPGEASEVSELGGMMRVNRKPIAPVELDSTPLTAELDGQGSGERG
ncbi:hypothetical protein SVAN01_09259 [Stagonosporopsis vannaccii]|nr:hypothetical protein SVAN01_09259 [Stagonosporopsis vannaccii]